jgi:uncharacterized membrane protein (UPF0127 family)
MRNGKHSDPGQQFRQPTQPFIAMDSFPETVPNWPTADSNARLHGDGIRHPLRVRLAATFLTRLRGLLRRPPLQNAPHAEGLLITRCPSVHTLFMRYPIDVAYLDHKGMVTRCVADLAPWRFSLGGRHAAHALELPAGAIRQLGIQPGHHLEHPAFSHSVSRP